MRIARLPADVVEIAAHQNLSVRLQRDGKDTLVRIWIEGQVERAIRVEPGDAVARDRRSPVRRERGEPAAEKNLAVRLDHYDADIVVRAWIETVERGLPANVGRAAHEQHRHGKQGERCFFHRGWN